MGARIRAYDWSASPLGRPETWPQSLRTAVSIMLNCAFPHYLAWGPELISFYNDAYAPILGNKEEALGRPFPQVWSEVWDVIGPITRNAIAGQGSYHENMPLTLQRTGYPEQRWFTFSYSPIRDETGGVGGVSCIVQDTTEKVQTERRLRFYVELGERLGGLTDPREVMAAAAGMLGRHLQVSRAGYGELDETGASFTVERDWTDGTIQSVAGAYQVAAFGPISEQLRAGRIVQLDDVRADPRMKGREEIASYQAIGILAGLAVPLIKGGRIVAALWVHEAEARRWRADEVALVQDVAARTWDAVERARTEASLRDSEERFRQLANLVPAFVWIADPDGTIGYLNDRLYVYAGLTPEQVLPDGWANILHADDVEKTLAAWEKAIRLGTAYEMEHRVQRHDGEYRWFVSRAEPVRNDAGDVMRWFGFATDIHDRRQAEAALRESEERFRQFAKYSSNVLWIWDVEGRRLEYLSPAFEWVWGEPCDAVLRDWNHWLEMIHPDDRDRIADAFARLSQGDVSTQEYRIIRADGTVRWIRDAAFLMRDEQGRAQRAGGTAEDITKGGGARVYLVNADETSRETQLSFLANAGYEVKAFASTRAFLEVAAVLASGCVVLDARNLEAGGLAVPRELRPRRTELPVIATGELGSAVQYMKAGAVDFIEVPSECEALLTAVASAVSDIHEAAERNLAADFVRARVAELTAREHEVLDRLLVGGTNKTIARELGISPRTVEIHRARVMGRLGAQTLIDLMQMASSAGLLTWAGQPER